MTDPHAPRRRCCLFRFYGPLNDFLAPPWRQQLRPYHFSGSTGLRDSLQAQGIPHCEVTLVLVDGVPRPPEHRLQGGERVSVYPRFYRLTPSPAPRWQSPLPDPRRFILDVHLGSLSRHLRLLGFDSLWGNDFEDTYIIDQALADNRIILTRDLGLLKQGRVRHGYFVRHTDPARQIEEIVEVFELGSRIAPLSRCVNCNGELVRVDKSQVMAELPPGTRRCYDTFYQCRHCDQLYWRGAHYEGLLKKLALKNDWPADPPQVDDFW